MFRLIPLLLLAVTYSSVVKAQQTAHVHGLAFLNLAMTGNALQLEFISPADGMVGFEHEPVSDKEKQAVQGVLRRLAQANNLLGIPEPANCRLLDAETAWDSDHEQPGHREDHEHEGHGHEVDNEIGHHAEFHARYDFECNGHKLQEIELTVFDNWPRIRSIEFQALTSTGQTGGNITATNRIIRLP